MVSVTTCDSSYFEKHNPYEEPDNSMVLMHKEINPLKSYTNWSCTFLEPKCLAEAGFYYVNKEDILRCAFCYIELGQWQRGDNVMANHRVWSPDYPFVCGKICGNVFTTMLSTCQDTCDQYGIEIRPNSFPERESGSTSNNRFNVSKMGVQPHRRPAYAGYVTLEQRLNSFAGWTHSINQRPEQLAAAGFFYNGKKDQTICFHCGGGLKDWEVDDNPWEQHAKWFSKCNFVLLQKGSEYISEMYSKELSVLQIHPVSSLNITPVNHSKTDTSSTPSVLEVTVTEPKRIETTERGLENDNNINTFCKVCYAQEVSVVFTVCDCALALTTCAVCCKPVEATVRGFLQ